MANSMHTSPTTFNFYLQIKYLTLSLLFMYPLEISTSRGTRSLAHWRATLQPRVYIPSAYTASVWPTRVSDAQFTTKPQGAPSPGSNAEAHDAAHWKTEIRVLFLNIKNRGGETRGLDGKCSLPPIDAHHQAGCCRK